MTGFRASGAMVATYWSVSVTVRIAQTEITETGISSDASTTSTHALIPACPTRPAALLRAVPGWPGRPRRSRPAPPRGPSRSFGHAHPQCLVPNGPGVHGSPGCSTDRRGSDLGPSSGGPSLIALSALSAFVAPLVFVGIIVLRKVERRFNVQFRHWSKRLQHEIARWS